MSKRKAVEQQERVDVGLFEHDEHVLVPSFPGEDSSFFLQQRHDEIQKRLAILRATHATTTTATTKNQTVAAVVVPDSVIHKIDTHWDYVLKEMQWLATDFQAERKRHQSRRKKVHRGILQYQIKAQQIQQQQKVNARLFQRKRAIQLAKHVRTHYWNQIHKIITFQQQQSLQQAQKQIMKQQLNQMIRQTEKYTSLILQDNNENTTSSIEQALQGSTRKTQIHKYRSNNYYQQLADQIQDEVLYGHPTTDDDNRTTTSSSSYSTHTSSTTISDASWQQTLQQYQHDPHEIPTLLQDQRTNVQTILQQVYNCSNDDDDNNNDEDRNETILDDDEEFQADPNAVDDETTLIQEESLPQEMTPQEEMAMLQADNALSIEELRRKYAGAFDYDGEDEGMSIMEQSTDKSETMEDEYEEENPSIYNDDDDDEFQADPDAVDDETTLIQEESLPQEMTPQEEMAMLQADNALSIEELRQKYAQALQANNEEDDEDLQSMEEESDGGGGGESDEFEPDPMACDDETTMEQEERLPQEISPEDEIRMLKEENELSVEELRARYSGAFNQTSTSIQDASEDQQSGTSLEAEDNESSTRESEDDSSEAGTAALVALEASAETARATLATRPYLISSWVKLRPYQQTGLNWLVSLQTHRLNGILADGKLTSSPLLLHTEHFTSLTVQQKWALEKPFKRYHFLLILRATKVFGDLT